MAIQNLNDTSTNRSIKVEEPPFPYDPNSVSKKLEFANKVGQGKVNFIHVREDSHFWTDISQLLEYLRHQNNVSPALVQYLRTGLENTLKEGYNIQKIQDDKGTSNTTEGPY